MKPYERRQAGAYPYFKCAVWDARNCCWRDGRDAFASEAEAAASANPGTRIRLSEISESGRRDLPEREAV